MSREGSTSADTRARYQAVRALTRRRPTRSAADLSYALYAILLGAAVLLPLAWTALGATGQALAALVTPWSAVAVGCTGLAAIAAGGARRAGPLITTAPEVAFLLQGQFPAHVVLARRAGSAVLLAALLAALVALALSGQAGVGAAALYVATAWAGGVVVVWASIAGQGSTRPAALGVTIGLLAAALLAVTLSAPPAAVLVAVVVLGVGALLCLPRVLDGVDPEALLAQQGQWRGAAGGVLSGDQRLAALSLGGRPTRRNGRLLVRLLVRRPGARLVWVRDVLGLYRARERTATSLAVAVTALLVPATGCTAAAGGAGQGLAALVAALVVYGCTGSWVEGLSAHVDNAGGTSLMPHSPQRLFWWHSATPVLLAIATACAATAVAMLAGAASVASASAGLATALLCAAVRIWVVSAPLLPLSLLSPISTPVGDFSMVVVAGWFLRGWVLIAVLAGAGSATSGDGSTLLWSVMGAATAVVLTARTTRAW